MMDLSAKTTANLNYCDSSELCSAHSNKCGRDQQICGKLGSSVVSS